MLKPALVGTLLLFLVGCGSPERQLDPGRAGLTGLRRPVGALQVWVTYREDEVIIRDPREQDAVARPAQVERLGFVRRAVRDCLGRIPADFDDRTGRWVESGGGYTADWDPARPLAEFEVELRSAQDGRPPTLVVGLEAKGERRGRTEEVQRALSGLGEEELREAVITAFEAGALALAVHRVAAGEPLAGPGGD